ncbi:PREDICTED: uncharacterized protein LOC104746040 [Camelina sativa]|uniref:S-protein homolog n=1 Tax=Camelina sativa TaxID=90675 RepID=A0ABM0W4W9_CAMSA|nr:PREDICTED: uncharacterized protein LOC104746040 [Camelina sativa]
MGSLLELAALLIITTMCVNVVLICDAQNARIPTTGFDNPRTTVFIHNDLGGSLLLWYHCKSKSDDFGVSVMPPNETWSFKFKPSIFGGTLFFCRFGWEHEMHYFDIYKQSRDREFAKFGCRNCHWKIQKNGACKLNKETNMYDVCQPWNS